MAGDRLIAMPDGPAAGRMDLLTILAHELGHVVGHPDVDNGGGLMAGVVELGERRGRSALPAVAARRGKRPGPISARRPRG